MSEFKKMLEDYGMDYQATMGRFMGNEQIYLRILSMLPEDENLAKLNQSLLAGDYNAAFDAAHTLKGMSGNLGLTPLWQAVSSIVEPLRAGESRDDYQALYQVVQLEYEKVENLLSRLKGGV